MLEPLPVKRSRTLMSEPTLPCSHSARTSAQETDSVKLVGFLYAEFACLCDVVNRSPKQGVPVSSKTVLVQHNIEMKQCLEAVARSAKYATSWCDVKSTHSFKVHFKYIWHMFHAIRPRVLISGCTLFSLMRKILMINSGQTGT